MLRHYLEPVGVGGEQCQARQHVWSRGRAERLRLPGEVRQGRSEFPMTPLQCSLTGAMLRVVALTPEMLLLGKN